MVSGHPWINDEKIEILSERTQDGLGSYYAGAHFETIENLWQNAYKGVSVPPDKLTNMFVIISIRCQTGKRCFGSWIRTGRIVAA